MQSPRPVLIRVHLEDGSTHDMKCGSAAQVGWKKLSETILALPWDRLEAFDEEETLIRATAAGMDEEDPSSTGAPVNVPPSADPETARLMLVAQLLANAYRHSTDVAFQRLSDLISGMQRQVEHSEQTREKFYQAQIRALEQQLRAAGQEPAQGNDLLGAMLGSVLSGMASGQAKPTNGANGSS